MREAGRWRRQLEEGWESRVVFPAAQSSGSLWGWKQKGPRQSELKPFNVSTVSSYRHVKRTRRQRSPRGKGPTSLEQAGL